MQLIKKGIIILLRILVLVKVLVKVCYSLEGEQVKLVLGSG